MNLNNWYISAKIILVLCVAVFFGITAYTIKELPKILHSDIISIGNKLDDHLTTVENKADTHLSNIETTVNNQATVLQTNLNTGVTSVNQILATLETHVNTQATSLNNQVAKLTDTVIAIPNDIKTKFGPQFDCDNNGYCTQNLITDTLIASKKTMQDISLTSLTVNNVVPGVTQSVTKSMNLLADDTLPHLSLNLETITKNSADITGNIKKITTPKWYDRVIGYGLNGLVMYRQLNPASQVIQTVIQGMSSQK